VTREKPIGTAEQAVLRGLLRSSGVWVKSDGALWENLHWTVTLLGTLAGKGLVREIVQGEHYELTSQGRERLPRLAL
jgi:hypothetical protein